MRPDSPSTRRTVPRFTPVLLRHRADGWTPMRQADFLGALAETWSVTAAAARVGKSRESAYRLRAKPGAESFAAAWDAILGQRDALIACKITNERLLHRVRQGILRPVMRRGKHVGTERIPDFDAFRQLYRRELRRRRAPGSGRGRSR